MEVIQDPFYGAEHGSVPRKGAEKQERLVEADQGARVGKALTIQQVKQLRNARHNSRSNVRAELL
ncbi:MAG: hypothetical protein WBV46_05750 [Terriglobales bacterium]